MIECEGCRALRAEMAELRAAVRLMAGGEHVRANLHSFGVGDTGPVRLALAVSGYPGIIVDPATFEAYRPSNPYLEARADVDGVQLIYSEDGVTERLFQDIVFDLNLDGDVDGVNTAYTPRDDDGNPVRLSAAVISIGGVVKYSTLDFTLEDGGSGIEMLSAPIVGSVTTVGGKRDLRVVIGRKAVRDL